MEARKMILVVDRVTARPKVGDLIKGGRVVERWSILTRYKKVGQDTKTVGWGVLLAYDEE